MTISNNLFQSILSMDAYNRGYSSGLADGVNLSQNGQDIDGLGGIGSRVGTATVFEQANSLIQQRAGFYAQAYSIGSGDKTSKQLSGTRNRRGAILTSIFAFDIDLMTVGSRRPSASLGFQRS